MEHTRIVFLFSLLALFALPSWGQEFVNIDIQYIGNEGFWVSTPTKSILIDALFENELNGSVKNSPFAGPSPATLEAMISGHDSFARIDLVLVTHEHWDHFSLSPVQEFLHAHPKCQFLGNPLIAQQLNAFVAIRSQVTGLSLDEGEVYPLSRNEILIKACGTPHSPGHMAYIVDLGEVKILHCGDSILPGGPQTPGKLNLAAEGIDILFYPNYINSPAEAEWVRDVVQPKLVVLMHVPPDDIAEASTRAAQFHPTGMVFRAPLDKMTISIPAKTNEAIPPIQNATTGALFNSIQAAIDAANPGDIVVLKQGKYYENLTIPNDLTLQSVHPDDPEHMIHTVIHGQSDRPVIRLSGSQTKLWGLTLTGGNIGIESQNTFQLVNCRVLSHQGKTVTCSPLAGDLNGDCQVNALDLALLAKEWLAEVPQDPVEASITILDPYITATPPRGGR